ADQWSRRGRGQQIVCEAGGLQLALSVVAELFKKSAAEALDHAADQLALDDKRVERAANIRSDVIALDRNCTGLDIHRDLGRMDRKNARPARHRTDVGSRRE